MNWLWLNVPLWLVFNRSELGPAPEGTPGQTIPRATITLGADNGEELAVPSSVHAVR